MISARKKINKRKVLFYGAIMVFMFGGMGYMLVSQVFPDLIELPSFGEEPASEVQEVAAIDAQRAEEDAAISSIGSGIPGLGIMPDLDAAQYISDEEKLDVLVENFPNDCKGVEQESRCNEQPGNAFPFVLPKYKDKAEDYDSQ